VEPGERMRVKLVRRNEELGQSRTGQDRASGLRMKAVV
jgi:hypothetical protein